MKSILLALLASLVLIGCSKDGSGSRLANGPEMPADQRLPTDIHMPEPE